MSKCNYLGNLPIKNYNLKIQSEDDYIDYIINGLLTATYNTDDSDLRNYKDCFTGTMIKKIYNCYDIENYFTIRKYLVQYPENLIKYLKDDLVLLLGKNDLEIIQETKEITNIYEFNFLYERVKVDNKYKRIKRDIKVSDIYQVILELDKKINSFISSFLENVLSNEISSNEIEILLEMLENNDNQNLFKKFEDNFGTLKDCKIPIIEKLYQYHLNELMIMFKQRLKTKINILGMREQREKNYEILDYKRSLSEKGVFDKKQKTRFIIY